MQYLWPIAQHGINVSGFAFASCCIYHREGRGTQLQDWTRRKDLRYRRRNVSPGSYVHVRRAHGSLSCLTQRDSAKDSTRLYPFWSCSSSLYLSRTLPSVWRRDPHATPTLSPARSFPPSSFSSSLPQPPVMLPYGHWSWQDWSQKKPASMDVYTWWWWVRQVEQESHGSLPFLSTGAAADIW